MPPKGGRAPAENVDAGDERSARRKKTLKKAPDDKKGSKATLKAPPPERKGLSGEARPRQKQKSIETSPAQKAPTSLYMPPGVSLSDVPPDGPRLTKEQLRPIAMKWVKRTLEKGVDGLRMEFAGQKKPVDPSLMKEFVANWPNGKNRYKDVGCLDETRVVLNPKSGGSDYIHANYVSTPQNDKRFICTQGPLDPTIPDFWKMVIQERSSIILMLCNIVEKGMKKCSEYWPQKPGDKMTFDNMTVVNFVTKIHELPMDTPSKVQIRISGICIFLDGQKVHSVDHMQWVDWPDRGVPPCDLTAIALLNQIRRTVFPIIVHCSAGIGRTGSIVMLEYMLERLMVGEEIENMDVLLTQLRNQRACSIQTDHQYLYIHRVMLEYFVKKSLITTDYGLKIAKFITDYNKMSGRIPIRRRYSGGDDEDMEDSKRRRGPEIVDLGSVVVEHIASLGTKGDSSVESELENLAQMLKGDIDAHKEVITNAISEGVSYQPNKVTIFSTLIGLLNASKHNFGGDVLKRLVSDLEKHFIQGDFPHAANIITFACDLANAKVVTITSVLDFLENFVAAIFEDNNPQVRSDWCCFAVLKTLPYIAAELNAKKPAELENMLEAIKRYVEGRTKQHVPMLQVWSKTVHEQEDYIDCLWAQISKMKEDGWIEKHFQRHYVAFDSALADALQHNLPSVTLPEHSSALKYPPPKVVFRLFDYSDCDADMNTVLPGAHSIERFLIEEDIHHIILLNILDRKRCAAELLDYPKRSLIPLNYVIVECLFAQMMQIPRAPGLELFYGSVLIQLCGMQPGGMPQVLAQAAQLFYERLDTMQPSCTQRLIDWFSYHLSNFQYKWSWNDWTDCLTDDALAPKTYFVREVVEKCLHFSYHQQVVEFLPSSFTKILPDKPFFVYPYDEEHPDYEVAEKLRDALKMKKNAEEMLIILRRAPEHVELEPDAMDQGGAVDPASFRIFFTVLLSLAQKSFSHNFAALTRYHETLKTAAEESDAIQGVILRTLYDSWRSHQQMMFVLIDKLFKMQVIEAYIIVAWVFSDEMKPEFERLWLWEVLSCTVTRVSRHYEHVKAEYEKYEAQSRDASLMGVKPEDGVKDEPMDEEQAQRGDDLNANDVSNIAQITSKLGELKPKLEKVESGFRSLLLDILHKFTVALSEHIMSCENLKTSPEASSWYIYVMGRFRQFFQTYSNHLRFFVDDIQKELFSATTIDGRITEVFEQFKALLS